MILKDETACSQGPEQWGDQDNFRLDILNMLSGFQTLIDTLFGDVTIKEGRIELNSEDELFVFAQFLPNVRQIVLDSELMGCNVQLRFCVSDQSDFCFSIHSL